MTMVPYQLNFLGECHHLASALNELYQLPLCVLYGERWENKESVLIHVGVIYKGCFIDELGLHSSAESVLEEITKLNPAYNTTSILEFDCYENPAFYELLRKCGADLNYSKLDYFKAWIKSNSKFSFLNEK